MVAFWATADELGDALPAPTEVDALSAELVDLALLASSRGRTGAGRGMAALCEVAPGDDVVPRARRARAGLRRTGRRGRRTGRGGPRLGVGRGRDAAAVVAAFDWLALAELGMAAAACRDPPAWTPRGADAIAPSPALDRRRRRWRPPLSEGIGVAPDARSMRVLLGMAALSALDDEDQARVERTRRGLERLVRFARQLMLDDVEAADFRGGRTGVGGVQRSPSDPEQSLAATATTRIAVDLLLEAAPRDR